MSDEHRVKIQNSNVLNALIEHVEGKRDMSATQVTSGVALLRKVLPDLASVTIDGDGEGGAVKIDNTLTIQFVRPSLKEG
jgi:hypothetical protein